MRNSTRHISRSLALLIVMALVATFTAATVSAQSPQEKDFFGTVVSAGGGVLVITTDEGIKEVTTSESTKVRLPLKRNAKLTDLAEGDLVAVSLDEEDGVLVADKVFLIPGKTQFRHVPGEVTAVSDIQITILPPGEGAEAVTFSISTAEVRFHKDTTELAVGSFVIVVAGRDPVTGQLLTDALEINVTKGQPSITPTPEDGGPVVPLSANTVDIRGVFQGVDPNGNWLIDGKPVAVNADTEVNSAVAVGQVVEVEAVLLSDGSLLATEIEAKDEDRKVSKKTKLEGIFEGVDSQGNWLVSGTPVAIGPGTDTDGLPYVGQRVKVKALLQQDGSLLAREVENKGGLQKDEDDDSSKVRLEGIFQGVDADGNWLINGAKVSVDPLTRLEGSPAPGQLVEVKGVLQPDGSILAVKVEGEGKDPNKNESEAEIRGTVTEIRDDAIVVNGVTAVLSLLTEVEGTYEVGDYVEVKAALQEDGTLVAREVEGKGKVEPQDVSEPSEVEIEGTIESISADGTTLVVNGITVVRSALSEVKGELVVGASVEVEGVLLEDGSVLAGELKGEGRKATTSGTEVKIEGVIEAVLLDTLGRLVRVNGVEVRIDENLTRVEGSLVVGGTVEIKAIIVNGQFLASKIDVQEEGEVENEEQQEGEGNGEDQQQEAEAAAIKIEGVIEDIQRDAQGQLVSIRINGIDVAVAGAKVQGDLVVGGEVEIKAIIDNGQFLASKIESEEEELEEEEKAKFKLEGLVQTALRDADGNIVGLVVNGQTVTVEALTRIRGTVEVGARVEVEGAISGDIRVATKIESEKDEDQEDRSDNGSEEESDESSSQSDSAGTGDQDEQRVTGTILTIDGTTWTMTVGGETRTVDVSDAEIEGEPAANLVAEVRGSLVNGTLVATEVKIEEFEEDD